MAVEVQQLVGDDGLADVGRDQRSGDGNPLVDRRRCGATPPGRTICYRLGLLDGTRRSGPSSPARR